MRTVSSVEPLSTTIRSSQNARLSRQAAILLASFLVMTMAESLSIASSTVSAETNAIAHPPLEFSQNPERQRQIIFAQDLPASLPIERWRAVLRRIPSVQAGATD